MIEQGTVVSLRARCMPTSRLSARQTLIVFVLCVFLAFVLQMPLWWYAVTAIATAATTLLYRWKQASRLVWCVVAAGLSAQATAAIPSLFPWSARFCGLFVLIALLVLFIGSQLDDL
jgi:4-hydroxybenzoate polyprenyltransferase